MSGLLLDTHVALWWLAAEPLSPAAVDAITDPATDVHVSVASLWELAIKASLGRFRLEDEFVDVLAAEGLALLPVRPAHVYGIRDLPLHHRDPFDRMLVAQARAEGLTLVTRDAALGADRRTPLGGLVRHQSRAVP